MVGVGIREVVAVVTAGTCLLVSAPVASAGESRLAPGLDLPYGSFPLVNNAAEELWVVPRSYTYEATVVDLQGQLPIGQSYAGLPWCAQYTLRGMGIPYTLFQWGGPNDLLKIDVSEIDTTQRAPTTNVVVDITRGPGVCETTSRVAPE